MESRAAPWGQALAPGLPRAISIAYEAAEDSAEQERILARVARIEKPFDALPEIAGLLARARERIKDRTTDPGAMDQARKLLECLNTALERLCDEVHPERADGIRNAKDAAAGAVLCAAIAAAAVGCLVFLNRTSLAVMGAFFKENTILSVLLILTLIPLIFFVRGGKREKK